MRRCFIVFQNSLPWLQSTFYHFLKVTQYSNLMCSNSCSYLDGYIVLGVLDVLRSFSLEGVLQSREQRNVTWREVSWIRWLALQRAPIYDAFHVYGRKNSPATQCGTKCAKIFNFPKSLRRTWRTIFQFMLRVIWQSSATFHDTWNCLTVSLTAAHNLKVRTFKVLISLCASFTHSKPRTRDLHPIP